MKKGEGTGAPEPPVEGERKGKGEETQAACHPKKVSARGEPRNRTALRRVSCQAEMASSKSLLAQASLG